jgi:hypothetical protein
LIGKNKIQFNWFRALKAWGAEFKIETKVQYFFCVKLGIQLNEERRSDWHVHVLKVTALWRSVRLFQTLKVTFFGTIRIILVGPFLYHSARWWRTFDMASMTHYFFFFFSLHSILMLDSLQNSKVRYHFLGS